jgi:hypothetical protein
MMDHAIGASGPIPYDIYSPSKIFLFLIEEYIFTTTIIPHFHFGLTWVVNRAIQNLTWR